MKPKVESQKMLRRLAHAREVEDARADDGQPLPVRPKTRAECVGGCRPCPFVSCRHHLAIDVSRVGSITVHGDPSEMEETCALDIADQNKDGVTLDEIGRLLGPVTRERVRQIAKSALEKVHTALLEGL
jgi:hypothetical protein